MPKCAYFKDGPKAGEFFPVQGEGEPVIYFGVFTSIADVMNKSASGWPTETVKFDEYRYVGTVELYEYVGRR